jgi:hypothetical protein
MKSSSLGTSNPKAPSDLRTLSSLRTLRSLRPIQSLGSLGSLVPNPSRPRPQAQAQAQAQDASPGQPKSTKKTALAVSRVGQQGRALRLFGKWRRLSRSGIPALNNCLCGYDDGVETQDLEPLMLEFLLNKFSHSNATHRFLQTYEMRDARFKSALSVLLDDVVHDTAKLSDQELAMVLDALEISIQSIEEASLC